MTSWPFSNSPRSGFPVKKPAGAKDSKRTRHRGTTVHQLLAMIKNKTPRVVENGRFFLEEGMVFLTRIHKKTPGFFASAFLGGENCCYNLIWCFLICFFWWLLVQHVHSQRNFERYGPVLQFTMLCAEATKAFSKCLQNSHWDSSRRKPTSVRYVRKQGVIILPPQIVSCTIFVGKSGNPSLKNLKLP